jgi:hypothetical protein
MTTEAPKLTDPYSGTYTSAGSPQTTAQGLCLPFAATAFMGLMLLAGTGGVLSSQPLPSPIAGRAFPTGATCQIGYAPQRRRDPSDDEDDAPTAVTVALTELQEQFAFNISELSAVLQVSRPTVYSWIRGDAEPRGGSLQRIDRLNTLVKRWNTISSQSIASVLRGRPIERSRVMVLLADDKVLVPDAIGVIQRIAAGMTSHGIGLRDRRPSKRSAEARRRSFSEETGA